jgi:rare lipoprotein A
MVIDARQEKAIGHEDELGAPRVQVSGCFPRENAPRHRFPVLPLGTRRAGGARGLENSDDRSQEVRGEAFAATASAHDVMMRGMRSRRVRAVLVGALAPWLALSLACGTARNATTVPPHAEPSEPERWNEPTSSTVPPSSPRELVREQRDLEQAFHGKKALRTLLGEASYYSDALSGRRTASGERYDPKAYTAAHRSLPFGTVLRVQRKDTGSVVYVRVNDRGPFGKRRRILDLSKAAAEQLGMIRRGIADVRIEVVEEPAKER